MNIDNNNRKTNYASNKLSKFHFFFPAHRFCFKLGIYLTLGVQEDHMAMRLIGHGNFFAVPAIMTLPSELVTKTADINHQLSI